MRTQPPLCRAQDRDHQQAQQRKRALTPSACPAGAADQSQDPSRGHQDDPPICGIKQDAVSIGTGISFEGIDFVQRHESKQVEVVCQDAQYKSRGRKQQPSLIPFSVSLLRVKTDAAHEEQRRNHQARHIKGIPRPAGQRFTGAADDPVFDAAKRQIKKHHPACRKQIFPCAAGQKPSLD